MHVPNLNHIHAFRVRTSPYCTYNLYLVFRVFSGIADQKKENEDFSYDDIDWDTLPEEINHTRSHVQSLLGNRFGRRQSLDDSVVGIKVNNNSRRRRGALDALGLIFNLS